MAKVAKSKIISNYSKNFSFFIDFCFLLTFCLNKKLQKFKKIITARVSGFPCINAWANDKCPESHKNYIESYSIENFHSNKF